MSSPPLLLDRSNIDSRSPSPESNASHDRSDSESPRRTPGIGTKNNSMSASKRQSKSRSISTSIGLFPSPARSHKILKGVARRGYYEDVYDAYPSTDEDREGGSIPCESDSDGPPTLSARASSKKQSKLAAAKSRRQEERALADAFEIRLKGDSTQAKYGMFGKVQPSLVTGASESSALRTVEDQNDDDAKAARAEFRRDKPFQQYMEELDQVFKSNSRLPDRYRRMSRWWKGSDEPVAPEKVAWHRRHMRELEGEGSSEDSSPLSSPPSTTPEPPSALPSPAPQPESSQDISRETKLFVDPRRGESMVPLSVLKERVPLSVLEEIIAISELKEMCVPLPGDFELRNGALENSIPCATTESNEPPKRANEGPPMDVLEPPAKKLRKDSGASGGKAHEKDMGLTDDEVYETSPESRDSSVPDWVRRSRRPASKSTPLYRADQHPADKFLDPSPKAQDDITFIHVVDSDDEDSDESVVHWLKKKPLPRSTEPPRLTTPRKQETAPVISPSSSGTPKKRGRKPGTRVVNGKVVPPSEEGTPSVPKKSIAPSPKVSTKTITPTAPVPKVSTKATTPTSEQPKFSFDEPTITKKRTPIPSEKVRANSMYAAATKKAPAQPKSSKTDTNASKTKAQTQTSDTSPKTTSTQSKYTKTDKSPAKRNAITLSSATSAQTRRENGFIRGHTDFEEEEEESTDAATTRDSDDAGKKRFTFRLPPRRPTPPYPKSSGLLNRRLFR